MKVRTKRERQQVLGLGVALAVLGAWVYTAYMLGPLWRTAAQLGQQLPNAREQLRVLETVIAIEPALQEQHRQLSQSVVALRGALPAEEDLPVVLQRLSEFATTSRVKLQSISPDRSLPPPAAKAAAPTSEPIVKELPIHLEALAGFHQFGTFLSLLESGSQPMQVSSLHMAPDPRDFKRQQITMVLLASFAADHQEAAAATP